MFRAAIFTISILFLQTTVTALAANKTVNFDIGTYYVKNGTSQELPSYPPRRVGGIELRVDDIYIGMTYSDAMKVLHAAPSSTVFGRTVELNGEFIKFEARYIDELTRTMVDDHQVTTYKIKFTPYSSKAYLIVREVKFTESSDMPTIESLRSYVNTKFGRNVEYNGRKCRTFSDSDFIEAGKCWDADDVSKYGKDNMLSSGVKYMIDNVIRTNKSDKAKIEWWRTVIYSPSIENEGDDYLEMRVKEETEKYAKLAGTVSQSRVLQESADDIKLAAFAMFGVDYQQKKPSGKFFFSDNDWYNVSENPVVFRSDKGKKEMVISQLNKCSYKASITINEPEDKNWAVKQDITFDFSKISDMRISNPLGSIVIEGKGKDVECFHIEYGNGTSKDMCMKGIPKEGDVYIDLDWGAWNNREIGDGVIKFFRNTCRKNFTFN